MSGGVDSAVSVLLLKSMGYEVVGVYMKLHDNDVYHKKNFQKAERVAKYFGIEIDFLDIKEQFKKRVYDYFVSSYEQGLTPNPCTVCNRNIKFGEMIKYADSLGVDFISTGHYARCDGEYIYKAIDKDKDQSYFLSQIDKSVIKRLIFPLGDRFKSEIKGVIKDIEALKDIGEQKESSEICFVDGDYTDVLKKHFDINVGGDVVDRDGNLIGTHKGYMHYTIGKRRGFRVTGAHHPHYVLELDPKRNRIVVARREELFVDEVELDNLNLFDSANRFEAEVKLRYRTKGVMADVEVKVKRDKKSAKVLLKEPVFGVAKGQFAVFYKGDRLVGGGVVVKSRGTKLV
jgi:tRNA-specific 2-thiouridylase